MFPYLSSTYLLVSVVPSQTCSTGAEVTLKQKHVILARLFMTRPQVDICNELSETGSMKDRKTKRNLLKTNLHSLGGNQTGDFLYTNQKKNLLQITTVKVNTAQFNEYCMFGLFHHQFVEKNKYCITNCLFSS
jgi:hypothetical protein